LTNNAFIRSKNDDFNALDSSKIKNSTTGSNEYFSKISFKFECRILAMYFDLDHMHPIEPGHKSIKQCLIYYFQSDNNVSEVFATYDRSLPIVPILGQRAQVELLLPPQQRQVNELENMHEIHPDLPVDIGNPTNENRIEDNPFPTTIGLECNVQSQTRNRIVAPSHRVIAASMCIADELDLNDHETNEALHGTRDDGIYDWERRGTMVRIIL
jgi:hypothetical protein